MFLWFSAGLLKHVSDKVELWLQPRMTFLQVGLYAASVVDQALAAVVWPAITSVTGGDWVV